MADPPASAPRMCEHTRGSAAVMSKSARLRSATVPRICERKTSYRKNSRNVDAEVVTRLVRIALEYDDLTPVINSNIWSSVNTIICYQNLTICNDDMVLSATLWPHWSSMARWTPVNFKKNEIPEDAMTWKHPPHYWPFWRAIWWHPVDSLHKWPTMWVFCVALLLVWASCWTNELCHHWYSVAACPALSHYLNQWRLLVKWTIRSDIWWNCNQIKMIVRQESVFKMMSAEWQTFCMHASLIHYT